MEWLVNGRDQLLDPSDRGLAYGDGLFETMAANRGRIRWLDLHLERLADGCRRLRIPPLDEGELRAEIEGRLPSDERAVVKLIVTRGSGARGYRPPARPRPTRILGIGAWPDYPASHYTEGIVIRTCTLRLSESPPLAGLKHLCRLEQVLAQAEVEANGADEGLLLDVRGRVVGGTSSNVFAVRSQRLYTPRIDRSGVRGVMRRAVLEACAREGIDAAEIDLEPEALRAADEIFVTNALVGLWPVAALDDLRLEPGQLTRRLQRSLGYPDA
jgi:4-amino-4-deoxychorismate lyase